MTNIKNQIDELRTWFMNNPSSNDSVKSNYLKILSLLKEGEVYNIKIGLFTCSALHELLKSQMARIDKIDKPNEIVLTGEPEATTEELYSIVREMVIMQLADF
jgi:hypothetical protein